MRLRDRMVQTRLGGQGKRSKRGASGSMERRWRRGNRRIFKFAAPGARKVATLLGRELFSRLYPHDSKAELSRDNVHTFSWKLPFSRRITRRKFGPSGQSL
jgi:hypothetical protein